MNWLCEVDYKKKRSCIYQNEEARDGLSILFVSDIDGFVLLDSVGIEGIPRESNCSPICLLFSLPLLLFYLLEKQVNDISTIYRTKLEEVVALVHGDS